MSSKAIVKHASHLLGEARDVLPWLKFVGMFDDVPELYLMIASYIGLGGTEDLLLMQERTRKLCHLARHYDVSALVEDVRTNRISAERADCDCMTSANVAPECDDYEWFFSITGVFFVGAGIVVLDSFQAAAMRIYVEPSFFENGHGVWTYKRVLDGCRPLLRMHKQIVALSQVSFSNGLLTLLMFKRK